MDRVPRFLPGWLGVVLCFGRLVAAEFVSGADFSHVGFFENRGVVYRERDAPSDPFEIVSARGLNCVRLRLFTSSAAQAQADPYNSINNLEYTIPLAVRAKRAGLQVMLDFHFSDSWADPGKQTKPALWRDMTFDQLEQTVEVYSHDAIAAFKAAGATPDYVQVGNEIIGGMLWPDGSVGGDDDNALQWLQFGLLLKAAIRGIEDAARPERPRVIVHIDRGGDWEATRWFFDHVREQRVPFEVVGQSYYPWWHGTFDDLRFCLRGAAARYEKPVMLVETAFPWASSLDQSIGGIVPGKEGQVAFVAALAEIVRSIPDGLGGGILWWGAEYVSLPGEALAGFDRRSFFDGEGAVLPVAGALGQTTRPVVLTSCLTAEGLILSWPLSGAGFSLRTLPRLTTPLVWSRFTHAVEISGSGFSTLLPLDQAANRFYRLQSN